MTPARARALGLLAAVLWACPSARETVAEPQRPLAEALRELVRSGLAVTWSEELVRPDMMVDWEPDATDPVERLRQLLAPHGLAARRGPGGVWLVVRAKRRQQATGPQPPGPAPATLPHREAPGRQMAHVFDEIVVTPQQTSFGVAPADGATGWSAEDVAAMPHVGDEPLQLVHRVAGVAAADTSSRFHLHGSTPRQVGFRLDGLDLESPYHLEGLQGLFSVVAPEAVERMDLVAGGFSAAYGNHLAGYVDVTTRSPRRRLFIAGISAVSSQVLLGGEQRENGRWLVSARRGDPGWLLNRVNVGGDLRPSFEDFYGKWDRGLGSRSLLSVHALGSRDREHFDDRGEDRLDGRQSGFSGWLTLASQWSPELATGLLLAATETHRDRHGFIDRGASHEDDRRDGDTWAAGLDLGFTGERAATSLGLSARRFHVDYDHDHVRAVRPDVFSPPELEEPFAARLAVRESDAGAFADERLALGGKSTLEAGLRWDRQSTTGEEQWSPRLGLVQALGERTVLRVAWGLYSQAQAVDELAVEDGDLTFYPAERSEHRLLSLDQELGRGLALRLAAYDQRITHPRPRYENLFDPIDLFPGLGDDRVRIAPERARSRGLDLLLRKSAGGRFLWSLGYSYSKAEDRVAGRWVPRAWDQPHAGVIDLDLRPRREWRLHLSAIVRSGWPTTRQDLITTTDADGAVHFAVLRGPRNGERFPIYRRLDLRLSRTWSAARGDVELFFDVFNIFNQENPCCVDELRIVTRPDGSFALDVKLASRLPRIPSFGLTWRLP
jgi:outer membrane receptor protein involved in Fe transport